MIREHPISTAWPPVLERGNEKTMTEERPSTNSTKQADDSYSYPAVFVSVPIVATATGLLRSTTILYGKAAKQAVPEGMLLLSPRKNTKTSIFRIICMYPGTVSLTPRNVNTHNDTDKNAYHAHDRAHLPECCKRRELRVISRRY